MLKENFTEEQVSSDYETERNKPMPSLNHSLIQSNLIFLIRLEYGKNFRIASELSLQLADWPSTPDISLLPPTAMDTANDVVKFPDPPLCVMEILSPTQSLMELLQKAKGYFEHGVKSCWLVIPGLDNIYVFSSARQYEIFRMGETLHDEKMDIKIEVSKVFE